MRFASLGSGSRGNALLVEAGDVRILVDCGFAAREIERRLAGIGVNPETLDALLVTHEHGDHSRGVGALARRYNLPVWMTAGTYAQHDWGDLSDLHFFTCHDRGFRVGPLRVEPYPVPHDAREPCQYIFRHGGLQLGCLTDAGAVTPYMINALAACDALLLECNHDTRMLREGPYPPYLQARVGGRLGHLNNDQAADLVGRLDHARLRHLVVGHLSEKNNHPDLARAALLEVAGALEPRLHVAPQDEATGWFEL
ncbi:MAG TPA: MBL fold metallo-hydrolase [Chromatiales bacterium]|nr:MBL fold metallo-hydrolase [Chromatiales bacterium]